MSWLTSKTLLQTTPDGWKVGMTVAVTVGLVTLISVPRPVAPTFVPLPRIDATALGAQRAELDRAALRVEGGLPFEVRAVGELIRQLGTQEATGAVEETEEIRRELRRVTALAARTHRGEPLHALWVFQAKLFVRAVKDWPRSEQELAELGGSFLTEAESAGWLESGALLAHEDALDALFRLRWARLTGLASAIGFRPTLEDWQLVHGFRLVFPQGSPGNDRHVLAQTRLAAVGALARRDKRYPVELARGVLRYQMGQHGPALEHFRRHLRRSPDGPFSLRARNFAAASARALAP